MPDVDLIPGGIDEFLLQQDRKELLRFLTAGSVDDGKSTLIGRMLHDSQAVYEDQIHSVRTASTNRGAGPIDFSLFTDGLRAEREQGITIDVAYRYFATSRRKFILADTPGHEQYTRNMATGASNCDLAIILVDARNGVVRQTKRHSFIVSLLGIKHVVVCVNKMDLMGYSQETFDEIVRDYTTFATRLGIPDLRFIPISALKGDNVVESSWHMPWYRGETLLYYLENVHIASDRNLIDLRFPVQYVNRPNLDFRGLSGTVASGVLRKGDEVMVLPSGVRSRIRTIVSYDGDLQEAFPPMAVTVTLTDDVDASRGDMLVHPANLPRVDQVFEAMVVWLSDDPLVPGKQYLLKQATSVVGAQVSTLRYKVDVNTLHREPVPGLAMNEVGRCTVRLSRRICFDPYARNRQTGAFIIIDRLNNRTVGAGMIVDRSTSLRFLEDHWDDEGPSTEPSTQTSVSRVTAAERQVRFGQRPVTILLTGLSGSGKTSIAYALERQLFDQGRAAYVLDGRRLRQALSRDLGFGAGERSENLRRAAEVARLVNDAGLICIAAFLAPSAAIRDKARHAIGEDRFVEVFVNASIEACRTRDREGLYERADRGEIRELPGVTSPYEAPANADLVLDTEHLDIDASVAQLMQLLTSRGVLS